MKKFIACTTVAVAMSFSAVSAHAGGWGGSKNIGGLINVSPTVKTGDINLLSGLLNGPILSGNGLDVLNIGGGILNILNTNDSGKKRRR